MFGLHECGRCPSWLSNLCSLVTVEPAVFVCVMAMWVRSRGVRFVDMSVGLGAGCAHRCQRVKRSQV